MYEVRADKSLKVNFVSLSLVICRIGLVFLVCDTDKRQLILRASITGLSERHGRRLR